MATIDAVLMNWRRPRNVARIIAALREQTVPCHLTLCDAAEEGSEFALPARVRAEADTVFRFSRNFGSLNRFIPCFGYMREFLYYQDDDLLPGPRALEWLLECAARRPDFGVLGEKGRILAPDGRYRCEDVGREPGEFVPVDFVVRAGFLRTEHLRGIDWWRRKMNLAPGGEPDLLREDDLLLCTAVQTRWQLPCLLTPRGEGGGETAIFRWQMREPHAMSAQAGHEANRTRFLAEAKRCGWRSLVGAAE